jgi:hypothetical protein
MLMRLACVMVVAVGVARCQTGSDPYMRSTGQRATAVSNDLRPDWMQVRNYADGGPVPPMEADRKINEQPCTEGVTLTAGNLKCQ